MPSTLLHGVNLWCLSHPGNTNDVVTTEMPLGRKQVRGYRVPRNAPHRVFFDEIIFPLSRNLERFTTVASNPNSQFVSLDETVKQRLRIMWFKSKHTHALIAFRKNFVKMYHCRGHKTPGPQILGIPSYV